MATNLELERQKSTFNTKALIDVIHGKEYEQKVQFEKLFSSNPLFDRTNDVFLSRPDYTKLAVKRSFETYKIVKTNKELLAAHSPIHGEGGFPITQFGVASGLTDHFSLFVGTLLSQGTKEQQREWIPRAVQLKIIGTYAQTELGHGSNIRALETTAKYDIDTDEFIISSNGTTGTKWWPGALGLLATHALVYARLLVGDKDYGFHAFVVQIRDENHKPMPGVEVGDIGPKLGYAAYDSGFLNISEVRVPRFNMLARFQQLEKGGAYRQAAPQLQKIAYLTMLKVRVYICRSAAAALGKTLTIAVRYTANRLQGFKFDGKKDKTERQIIDHKILQARLLPLIGTAYALHFAYTGVKKLQDMFEAALMKAKDGNVDAAMLPTLHATAAGLKAFSTNMALLGMEEARKCTGGHGYTRSSGFGDHYLTYLPAVTYEGDIIPMALQCARFLMGSFGAMKKGKKLSGPVAYLAKSDGAQPSTVEDFMDLAKLRNLFESASRRSTTNLSMAMYNTMKGGKRYEEAWNDCQLLAYRASYNHTLCFILTQFISGIELIQDPKIKSVMAKLCSLFAITRIQEMSVRSHRLNANAIHNAERAMSLHLKAIRPDAVALVDGFGFTDFQLTSTIGNYENNDMYKRMIESARANPLNSKEYYRTFHSEILSEFMNKQYLAKNKARL